MAQRELNPNTATVDELAAADRRLQRHKLIALAVGVVVALAAYKFLMPSLPEGLALPVIFIALAVGYIPTEEILKRM